jgi:hypothetical protein
MWGRFSGHDGSAGKEWQNPGGQPEKPLSFGVGRLWGGQNQTGLSKIGSGLS